MYILSLFINPSLEMKDVPLGQLVLAVLKSKHTMELCGIVQLNVPVFPMSSFFFPLEEVPTWIEFQPQQGEVDFKDITKQWQSGKKSEVLHRPMGEH